MESRLFTDISSATAIRCQAAVPRVDVHEHCTTSDGCVNAINIFVFDSIFSTNKINNIIINFLE